MFASRAVNNSRALSGTRDVKKLHVEISGKISMWLDHGFFSSRDRREGGEYGHVNL